MKVMDNLLRLFSYFRRDNLAHYIDLETNASDPYTFITKTGCMVSLIKLEGLGKIVGKDEFVTIKKAVADILLAGVVSGEHVVQIVFEKDDEQTAYDVKNRTNPARQAANQIGLKMDDLFDENENIIADACNYEDSYIAVWTNQSALSPDVVKEERIKNAKARKDLPFELADGVDVFRYVRQLQSKHSAYVDTSIMEKLRVSGAVATKLTTHEAGAVIRSKFDRGSVSPTWRPFLVGDKVIPRTNLEDFQESPKPDITDVAWPRLDWQLARQSHDTVKAGTVKVGPLFYKTIYMDIPPREIQRFGQLRIDGDIPYRISYHISKGGSMELTVKTQLNAFTIWGNQLNKDMQQEIMAMKQEGANSKRVKMQVAVCTWARSSDVLDKNVEKLSRAMQAWGNMDIEIDIVDETEGMVSTIPGVSMRSAARESYPPVEHCVHMMPLARPASLWDSGGLMFKTVDGKLYPFEPHSSKQTLTVDIFVAPPRQGKSVLSNAINKALCIRSGQAELPFICVLDIGPSSAGMVELIIDSLPEHLRHLAVFHTMKESANDCINPFDLQLGCKKPLQQELSFITNLFTQLLTPIGKDGPIENMMEMVAMLIERTYQHCADEKTQKRYHEHLAPEVDKAIKENRIDLPPKASWYEVRDMLFDIGLTELAVVAQRYAVPVLSDFAARVYDPAISRLYGKVTDKENFLQSEFDRKVQEILRDYPIFTNPTQIAFDNARIIAIDLQNVTEEGSDAADKKTGIMYLLGRYLGAKNYYLSMDDAKHFEKKYENYQLDRIKAIRQSVKRMVYDEFHKTSHQPGVRRQVLKDMREGGKWGIGVGVISQDPTDFPKEMVNLATNRFIMGGLAKKAKESVIERFGLTDVEAKILLAPDRLHGPKAGIGSSMLLKTKYDGQEYSQVINFMTGPKELWSYSTSFEDKQIRDELKAELGSSMQAREFLSKCFPSGTAIKEIERRNKLVEYNEDLESDEVAHGALKQLIEDLKVKAQKEQNSVFN